MRMVATTLVTVLVAVGCNPPEKTKTAEKTEPAEAKTEKTAPPAKETKTVEDPPWSVSYSDGSANGFRFWHDEQGQTRFEYDPMTPMRSSSGTYSGGSPREGELSEADAKTLLEKVAALEKDTEQQTEMRMKLTGDFKVTRDGKKSEFIIKNGAALRDFNAFVKKFRGK